MTHIVTPVLLDVETYLKGQRQQPRLVLWAFGGALDQDLTDACGSTRFTFQPDQRVVAFLKERGQAQGNDPIFDVIVRYAIDADGQATVDGRSMSLQQLLDDIRAPYQDRSTCSRPAMRRSAASWRTCHDFYVRMMPLDELQEGGPMHGYAT